MSIIPDFGRGLVNNVGGIMLEGPMRSVRYQSNTLYPNVLPSWEQMCKAYQQGRMNKTRFNEISNMYGIAFSDLEWNDIVYCQIANRQPVSDEPYLKENTRYKRGDSSLWTGVISQSLYTPSFDDAMLMLNRKLIDQ